VQDIENARDLRRAEVRALVGIQCDVAEVTSQVTRRSQFEKTGEWTPLSTCLSPNALLELSDCRFSYLHLRPHGVGRSFPSR
jgi:hypothetical protein